MPAYRYDPISSRYRDERGRYVSEKVLRGWLDVAVDKAQMRTETLAKGLQRGSLSLAEFQVQMMAEIKQVHVAAAMAAHGGKEMMDPASYGWSGSQIKQQYQYLRAWTADIESGVAPLDGRLIARARLYGNSPVATYEAMKARDARNSGARLVERNVLSAADHCGECPGLSAQGWVPLGSLPPVGSRQCKVNDRCRIERRLASEAA